MRAEGQAKPVQVHPITPDGRYFVVRGRLWRCANPLLPAEQKQQLVRALMLARRQKAAAMRAGDEPAREQARREVDAVKHALGERGPVWWPVQEKDWNRTLVRNSPYAEWFQCSEEAAPAALKG